MQQANRRQHVSKITDVSKITACSLLFRVAYIRWTDNREPVKLDTQTRHLKPFVHLYPMDWQSCFHSKANTRPHSSAILQIVQWIRHKTCCNIAVNKNSSFSTHAPSKVTFQWNPEIQPPFLIWKCNLRSTFLEVYVLRGSKPLSRELQNVQTCSGQPFVSSRQHYNHTRRSQGMNLSTMNAEQSLLQQRNGHDPCYLSCCCLAVLCDTYAASGEHAYDWNINANMHMSSEILETNERSKNSTCTSTYNTFVCGLTQNNLWIRKLEDGTWSTTLLLSSNCKSCIIFVCLHAR